MDELWVQIAGEDSPMLILGNAHSSFRGEFLVGSSGRKFHVKKSDIERASQASLAWIDGFLSGVEPSLFEFLGSNLDYFDSASPDDYARWDDWKQTFKINGDAPEICRLPELRETGDKLHDPAPWCYVGGLFRVEADGAWSLMSPQPEYIRGNFIAATTCLNRGTHDFIDDTSGTVYCVDCHLIAASD